MSDDDRWPIFAAYVPTWTRITVIALAWIGACAIAIAIGALFERIMP